MMTQMAKITTEIAQTPAAPDRWLTAELKPWLMGWCPKSVVLAD